MLRVLGSPTTDGLSRREMLRVGGLGMLGAGLGGAAPLLAGEESGGRFGQAKACILLYLYGSPSQLEMYDPKPDAPLEIRGDFGTTATAIPGLHICEHLPKLAKVIDKAAVIRSMTHPYNIHSAAYTLTGVGHVDIPMELNPYDARHWPYIGSVLEHLAEREGARQAAAVPRTIGLPFKFSSRCNQFKRGGPYSGFLGGKYDPVWTDFEGEASGSVNRWLGNQDQSVRDPFLGITPASRLVVSGETRLPAEVTLDRLDSRRSLLGQFDAQRHELTGAGKVQAHTRLQETALSLLASNEIRTALDLSQEKPEHRAAYGQTLFGQATLAARRLVEAGSKLVMVYWDEFGPANSAWDTHFDHYSRLKDELLPGLDSALSTLLVDLETRGLLDSTLVACISEHGRTPKLSNSRGGGREHWSQAYCGLLAGGGVRGGQVIGKTDKHAAEVADRPVSPKDVLATLYHLLGVPGDTLLHDRLGRPLPLLAHGEVMRELVG